MVNYYKQQLNFALLIARNTSNESVNCAINYFEDEGRFSPKYPSVKLDHERLINAKKRFEGNGEMDDYVLAIADRLKTLYDYRMC